MPTIKNTRSTHNKPFTPFYYIIGWNDLDKWYVGSRTANSNGFIAHPDELMKTYFTSSHNHVWPFMEENGAPDIIWTFPCKSREEAVYHEHRIMREFDGFVRDERWLNKHDNKLIFLNQDSRDRISRKLTGRTLSEEHKANVAAAIKRKWADPEYREMLSKAHANRPPISDETRAKLKASANRSERSEDTKQKISAAKTGKTLSEETRKRMSEAAKRRKKKNDPIS